MSGQHPLSPFGGSLSGRNTSVSAQPGNQTGDDDFKVVGLIRFWMPEEDVSFPLWDDNGLLPEEPELLESGLGISASLVADLQVWGARWNDRPRPTEAHQERLRDEANVLVERMRNELLAGLQVVVDL